MRLFLYISIFIFLLSSCFKEEDNRATINIAYEAIKIRADYSQQVFYNLNNKNIASENEWKNWNLAFYSQEDDYFIKLNSASNMKAALTSSDKFTTEINIEELEFKTDDPKGGSQRGINEFFNNVRNDTLYSDSLVYVLFLGINNNGDSLGYKKIVFDYVYKNQYHIRYSNLDGSEYFNKTILKYPSKNFTSFSFLINETVEIEPDKTTWDLLFTLTTDFVYTDDFSDTLADYSVTSALLNPYTTRAYLEEKISFDKFSIEHINESLFSNDINIIGYDWKRYEISSGNSGTYSIYPNKVYIINDGSGLYYKLKFLSFKDPETNERGTFSFEYEVLK